VLAGTAWHLTELHRFAEGGDVEALPTAMRVEHGAIAVLVRPRHKSGDMHRTAVSAEVLEAAERVRSRGAFSESSFRRAIDSACDAAKIARFDPGWFTAFRRHLGLLARSGSGCRQRVPGPQVHADGEEVLRDVSEGCRRWRSSR
jgi:hypothetical protein